ncbi:hypothetical protein [Mesorhizobium australicum]|uniref:hypothetical protein n=1 Tax=Mesorhizobium australicum TaxID=536018 RepID=UPI003336E2DC
MERMRRLLVLFGILGFIVLVVWLGAFVAARGVVVDFGGKGFSEPTFSVPAQEMLTHGEAVRDALVTRSNRWNWLFNVAGWVSLACTSLVTLLAGVSGNRKAAPSGRRPPLLIVIGVAGAVASATTAFGSFAKERGQDAETTAVSLTASLRRVVEGIRANPQAEAATLIELKTAIGLAER